MLFEYLEFNNYRPFYGKQRLEFRATDKNMSPERTVTLIGGLNGAGKTSILNAIFACLYGQGSFTPKEYTRLKAEAINRRYLADGGTESSVELGIVTPRRTPSGHMSLARYVINVTWVKEKRSTEEYRTVYTCGDSWVDRHVVSSTPVDCANFIETLLPKELAPLFIFDAEDLGNLISDTSRDETVRAIQRLVSLDLYRDIKRDLESRLLATRQELARQSTDKELTRLADTLAARQSELERTEAEARDVAEELREAERQARTAEDRLRNKLIHAGESRGKLQERINLLRQQAEELSKAVQKSLGNALPYAFLAPLIMKMRQRLDLETRTVAAAQAYEAASKPIDDILDIILSVPVHPPLTPSQKEQLATAGRKAVLATRKGIPQAPPPLTVRHEVTSSNRRILETWSPKESGDLHALEVKRAELLRSIADLEAQLNGAPEDVDTSAERAALQSANSQVERLRRRHTELNKRKIELTQIVSALKRQISDQEKLQKLNGPLVRKRALLDTLVKTFTEFTEAATYQTAVSLKHRLEEAVTVLLDKPDVDRVEFDPGTYTMHLYDKHGREIPIEQCSEGEKQVISLSLVWALTKVSGASIPFAIDTPLARLDQRHRRRLVTHFFPRLSEQVLILSTDTEIDAQFVADIKPYVRNRFLLRPLAGMQSTEICEGYFDFIANGVTA